MIEVCILHFLLSVKRHLKGQTEAIKFYIFGLYDYIPAFIIHILSLTTENVARGKAASQSGSFYLYSTADKAVDGNNNPSMDDLSCVRPGE